jgi:hypothetical protein
MTSLHMYFWPHDLFADWFQSCVILSIRFLSVLLHIVKDVVVVFREAFHPSIRPIIHPWMTSYREENLGRNKILPPGLRMCHCLRKAWPAGGGTLKILILISVTNPTYILHTTPENIQKRMHALIAQPWLAICCYLTGHKKCKHQDFQRPRSWWIHAECGI